MSFVDYFYLLTGGASKTVLYDCVRVQGVTKLVGRRTDACVRSSKSGLENLGTNAEKVWLRVVRDLGMCDW